MPGRQRREDPMKPRSHLWNITITVFIFWAAFLVSLLFQKLQVGEHITTLFVFAVFLISLITDGYVYGVSAAVASMMAINYAFTFPYFELDFIIPSNMISAVIMVIIAVLTGTLTIRIKRHEVMKVEAEKERMRANLLRAVSHDLRTPLTTIYGAGSTLLENREGLTGEQQESILRSICEDSEWLMCMVENLLSITRIDSGQVQIIKAPTVLDELIDSVMSKFGKRYPRQMVELETPAEIVVIPMDAILIEQVLFNLLENAVIHAKDMTCLELKVSVMGKHVRFEVTDNGCGLPENRILSVFQGNWNEQTMVADSKKRNAGIGLSVCATIVSAHNGEIHAENVPDGGARFWFVLERESISEEETENDQ